MKSTRKGLPPAFDVSEHSKTRFPTIFATTPEHDRDHFLDTRQSKQQPMFGKPIDDER